MSPTRPLRTRGATAVPNLPVGNLAAATEYYRDVLGFRPVGAPGTTSAVLAGHGTMVRLRQAVDGEIDKIRASKAWGPDAILFVPNPRGLRRRLDARGADIIAAPELGPDWTGFFGVADPYGTVLAIGPSTGPLALARQWVAGPVDTFSSRVHEWRRAREEAVHLDEFRAFYTALDDKRDIFYLFFSDQLLHWVRKALRHVPADVNLVLLGSCLPDDELEWIRTNVDRPFHHVRLRIDDRIAWEFLFAVNRHNFGWLDSDCVVLDSRLFHQLADLAPRMSLNCTWAWDSGFGWPLANTFFLFVNVDAIAEVRRHGADPNPCSHDYEWHRLLVPGRRCYSRRPSRGQLRLLKGLLPPGPDGRPATPHGMSYYDTMVMFQLLARACGFTIHQVRDLEGFGHLRGRPIQDESSDELLHIGGGSRADALSELTGFFHDTPTRLLYLIAEYVMLDGATALPAYYANRLDQIRAALAGHGLGPRDAENLIRQHLVRDRGLSPGAAATVLERTQVS